MCTAEAEQRKECRIAVPATSEHGRGVRRVE